ncbi:MAG TPA: hypothetical protein VHZ75_08875 [Solirubrobacteraceae bacterium]|nr:hypothetical protein [Solirubrobacteraceae bacterium]
MPPNFAAYCAVALPEPEEGAQRRHDHAVIATLTSCTDAQPWWLGYLETSIGAEEVVFYDAPRVTLYENWNYVLVEAGPDQALSWRQSEGPRAPWKGAVPDIMFPADRSWLLSTLWDDHWSGIGGSEALIAAFAHDRLLGGQTRVVGPCEDAAPPRRA